MLPDIGPLIMFGVWCFFMLVGLVIAVIVVLLTGWQWAYLVFPAVAWAAFAAFEWRLNAPAQPPEDRRQG